MIEDLVRDPSRQFPALTEPEAVTALRVWFCKYRTLAPLAELINLRTLVVAGYPDDDFTPIAGFGHLEYLRVLHFAKVNDLTPLARLESLQVLRLHSLPSWDASGRVIEVGTLAPIAQLPHLKHLELFGVRPANSSLVDLEEAPSLRTVRVSKYPKTEVARYADATSVDDAFAPDPPVPGWD